MSLQSDLANFLKSLLKFLIWSLVVIYSVNKFYRMWIRIPMSDNIFLITILDIVITSTIRKDNSWTELFTPTNWVHFIKPDSASLPIHFYLFSLNSPFSIALYTIQESKIRIRFLILRFTAKQDRIKLSATIGGHSQI